VSTGRDRILVGLLFTSVLINVALAHRLRQFNRLIGATPEKSLEAGTDVPPINAVDLRGQSRAIVYNNEARATVLYVFTPGCVWCARNMDNFKALVEKEGGQYRLIGLSLSEAGLTEYVAKNELKLPIYARLSPETLKTYKLGSTPQTIVISPEGKVLQDWAGAYVGDQKSQVEAFFHVSLPGLKELPKAEAAKN
jgi:peroxiredoxin